MSRLWLPDKNWRIRDASTGSCLNSYSAITVGSNGKRYDVSYKIGTWSIGINNAKIIVAPNGSATYETGQIKFDDLQFTLRSASAIGNTFKNGYNTFKDPEAPDMEQNLANEIGVTVFDKLDIIKSIIKSKIYTAFLYKGRINVAWKHIQKALEASYYQNSLATSVGINHVPPFAITGDVVVRPLFMSSSSQSDTFTIVQTGSESPLTKCLPAAIYFEGDFSITNTEATDQDPKAKDKKGDIRFRIDEPSTDALITNQYDLYTTYEGGANQQLINFEASEGAFNAARIAAEVERNQRVRTTEEYLRYLNQSEIINQQEANNTARQIWSNINWKRPENENTGVVVGLSSTTPGAFYVGATFLLGDGGLIFHHVALIANPNRITGEWSYWQQRGARIREYNNNIALVNAAIAKQQLALLKQLEKLNTVTFSTDLSLADNLTQIVLQGRDINSFKSIFDNAAGASGSTVFNYFNTTFFYDVPAGLYFQYVPVIGSPNVFTIQFIFGF